jgi:hypothetical protein
LKAHVSRGHACCEQPGIKAVVRPLDLAPGRRARRERGPGE